MDFMVTVGIRLDLADGTMCLANKVSCEDDARRMADAGTRCMTMPRFPLVILSKFRLDHYAR
ncbi:LOW QUALITY PROTEIN: hypothetical protein PHMEG_00035983 [Phytophthora megakarya]|uniref:Uncharacterized protein n=1 Tax=Phytophthora megakarya TaxID=4795 RepID=A0A225UMW3_9STRA|nr:LOW QUALITY PROTEIN: hypothetical protein PHMEG_00035983 [Phytophthora megakarya]